MPVAARVAHNIVPSAATDTAPLGPEVATLMLVSQFREPPGISAQTVALLPTPPPAT